ncbi:MAG: aspartate aminotransferase family protein, partial [Bacteroidetes bacterium]
ALAAAMDDDTAAVILETIPATLGMPVPSAAYLQSVRRLCDARGALLILDEVQAGLGRTGKLWAFQHYDILPDMVVLGKGLSGGIYPVTATVLRRPLERVFHPDPFIHVSTFGGAEPGCVVMQKVLELTADPAFLEHVNHMAALIAERMAGLLERHAGFLTGFRQKGLMMGLEMVDEYCGPLLTKTAYDNDLLMVYANNDTRVCQFLPPLIIEPHHLDEIFPRLDRALRQARRLRPLLKLRARVGRIFRKDKS